MLYETEESHYQHMAFQRPQLTKGHPVIAHGCLPPQVAENTESNTFQSGVKHAGWLWKRFGHGHKTKWKRLWVSILTQQLHASAANRPVLQWLSTVLCISTSLTPLSIAAQQLGYLLHADSPQQLVAECCCSMCRFTCLVIACATVKQIPQRPTPQAAVKQCKVCRIQVMQLRVLQTVQFGTALSTASPSTPPQAVHCWIWHLAVYITLLWTGYL